jgi:short-subunit dehydrogenase
MKYQNIVITGASRGIGAGLAKYYAAQGCNVALIGRDLRSLQKTKEEFSQSIDNILLFEADVSVRLKMQEIARELLSLWGHVDLVIANAGVGGLNPADSFDFDLHDQFVNINFQGTVNTVIPFISSMIKRRSGHLVSISSLAAFRGLPNAASYSSTKSAQKIFMESLRVDLKKYNIAVSSIHPGFVKTKMAQHSEFDMPFMVTVEDSVIAITKAISLKKAYLLFPRPMKLLTLINVHLPTFIYDRLLPLLSGKKTRRAQIF